MAKKLNKALGDILEKPIINEEDSIVDKVSGMGQYDVRDEAEARGKYHIKRHPPSGIPFEQPDEAEEPMDKVIIAIQHHFINGEFDKANALIQTFRGEKGGKFFTWHHMNQLMDWVRNIYRYTNMKDLSRNYYQHEMTKDMEIQGIDDLTKVRVRDGIVEKFVADTKKVLNKKLQMR